MRSARLDAFARSRVGAKGGYAGAEQRDPIRGREPGTGGTARTFGMAGSGSRSLRRTGKDTVDELALRADRWVGAQ